MSDTFDHEGDAWNSLEQALDEGFSWGRAGRSSTFVRDPLYYHTPVSFEVIEQITKKAYLLRLRAKEGVWVPKSACKRLNIQKGTVYVHGATYAKSQRICLGCDDADFEVLP